MKFPIRLLFTFILLSLFIIKVQFLKVSKNINIGKKNKEIKK